MTTEEFEKVVGRPPVEDDMERANCEKAGWAGHHQCGICTEHGKPRFTCGCLYTIHVSHSQERHETQLRLFP